MLVIGGGITGAGVALDAATRGLRVAPRRQGRLRVGDVVEVVEARARRDPLPAAEGSRPRLRGAGGTTDAAHDRAASRARAAVPPARVHPRRSPPRQARPHPRRDDVGVRPHRWASHRQAPQARFEGRSARLHADAAGRPARGVVHLLRRAGRRCPAHAHGGAHRGRLRRRGRELRDARRAREGRRRQRHLGTRRAWRRRVRDPRPHDRQRHRCVGRRRPRHRRGQAPRHDPAGQGHPHHGAVGSRAQPDRRGRPGAQGPPVGVRRAVGRSRERRVRVHVHRHHRHRLRRTARRSAVHARRHRVSPARDQRVGHDDDHRERRARHVGRPAAAGARCRQRTHRGSQPPALRARLRQPRRHGHRRQAHHLPAHGRRRGRRDHDAARPQGSQPHQDA